MSGYTFITTDPENVIEVVYDGVNANLLASMNVRLTNLENNCSTYVGNVDGVLGQLQDDIENLDTLVAANSSAIATETGLRELADLNISEAFAEDLLEVSTTLGDAIELESETRAQAVLDEATARGAAIASVEATFTTDVANLATQVTALAADLGSAEASIITVSDALATETAARAAQYSAIQADYTDNSAAILDETGARADADSALATSISVVSASAASNAAAIVTEASARASADSTLASNITAVSAVANAAAAAVVTEQSARIAADGSIEAKYGVKVDVNGHVAGFGLIATANNAAPSSAFVVTASSFQVFDGISTLPVFSISGGVVRMTNVVIGSAVIENLSIGTTKLAAAAANKVVAASGGSSTPTSLTAATWTTVASVSLSGTDWNDQSGTPGGQFKRIVTISVDMTAVDSGTFSNAFVSAKIRTGDGSGGWNDIWEGMSDGGVTSLKKYGQIKGSFTIVHDVDDGFVGLPNTRIYQLQLYATGATNREYRTCTITVQSVKK